jgi:hypothetical protein
LSNAILVADSDVSMGSRTIRSAAADLMESPRTALQEKDAEMDGRIGDLKAS